jgi:hypothetical protein
MEVWTIQIAQWRLAQQLDITLIDTTVKSGNPAFSPTWEMVSAYKNGCIGEEEYSIHYNILIREKWITHRNAFEEVLALPKVALACYCKAGDFCHRHLLKRAFSKIASQRGIPFIDHGELAPNS